MAGLDGTTGLAHQSLHPQPGTREVVAGDANKKSDKHKLQICNLTAGRVGQGLPEEGRCREEGSGVPQPSTLSRGDGLKETARSISAGEEPTAVYKQSP